jgi:hypothetical protein
MKNIQALFTQVSSIANMAESFSSVFSHAAKQTSEDEGERKRKRHDDSQAKSDTKPPALRGASDKEAQPGLELNDSGGSGSSTAAVAGKNGTDWTEDEVRLLKDMVDALLPGHLRKLALSFLSFLNHDCYLSFCSLLVYSYCRT